MYAIKHMYCAVTFLGQLILHGRVQSFKEQIAKNADPADLANDLISKLSIPRHAHGHREMQYRSAVSS